MDQLTLETTVSYWRPAVPNMEPFIFSASAFCILFVYFLNICLAAGKLVTTMKSFSCKYFYLCAKKYVYAAEYASVVTNRFYLLASVC